MTLQAISGGALPVASEAPEVSVVVPVYYNAETLVALYDRIERTFESAKVASWDITFVDDFSGDASRAVLSALAETKQNVRVIHLARNFGSWDAIAAGLGFARGRCVVVISADLQDPPEKLGEMLGHWRAGKKVVLATRVSRQDPLTSRVFSFLFYRLFRLTVSRDMPPGGFDFFVLDQQVAALLVKHAEKNSMITAALLYYGFDKQLVEYDRQARAHGTSRWTFWRKFKLMYDAILSNSFVPLRFISALGAVGVLIAFLYGGIVIVNRFIDPTIPPGWTALMVVTLFFHGLTLLSLGIVGEYIWRTFDAARKRPQFVVDYSVQSPQLSARAQGPLAPVPDGLAHGSSSENQQRQP